MNDLFKLKSLIVFLALLSACALPIKSGNRTPSSEENYVNICDWGNIGKAITESFNLKLQYMIPKKNITCDKFSKEYFELEYDPYLYLHKPLNEYDLQKLKLFKSRFKLVMSDGDFGVISRDMFGGVDNIGGIEIYDSQIEIIKTDAFADLKSMEYLELSENKIGEIEIGAFNGLESLQTLTIGRFPLSPEENTRYNTIKASLPNGLFQGLDSIKYLSLNGNNIPELSEAFFNGIGKSLVALDIKNNHITRLGSNTFTSLPLLKSLSLEYNEIRHVDPKTFVNLPSLQEIYFGHNPLDELPTQIFRDVKSLSQLSLDSTQLKTIRRGTFNNLPYLNILNLNTNTLISVEKGAFNTPLKYGLTIELNDSTIERLSTESFAGLRDLDRTSIRDSKGNKTIILSDGCRAYSEKSQCQMNQESIEKMQMSELWSFIENRSKSVGYCERNSDCTAIILGLTGLGSQAGLSISRCDPCYLMSTEAASLYNEQTRKERFRNGGGGYSYGYTKYWVPTCEKNICVSKEHYDSVN